jgi:hypothetical protein
MSDEWTAMDCGDRLGPFDRVRGCRRYVHFQHIVLSLEAIQAKVSRFQVDGTPENSCAHAEDKWNAIWGMFPFHWTCFSDESEKGRIALTFGRNDSTGISERRRFALVSILVYTRVECQSRVLHHN